MRQQHTIGGQQKGDQEQGQGILVPLDLPEFKIVSQSQQADGSLEVHVIAIKDCDTCPTCQYTGPRKLNTEEGVDKIYSKHDEKAVYSSIQGQSRAGTAQRREDPGANRRLNRSSLYYHPRPARAEEVQIKHLCSFPTKWEVSPPLTP